MATAYLTVRESKKASPVSYPVFNKNFCVTPQPRNYRTTIVVSISATAHFFHITFLLPWSLLTVYFSCNNDIPLSPAFGTLLWILRSGHCDVSFRLPGARGVNGCDQIHSSFSEPARSGSKCGKEFECLAFHVVLCCYVTFSDVLCRSPALSLSTKSAIAYLEREHRLQPHCLFGYSAGGNVCILHAAQHPGAVPFVVNCSGRFRMNGIVSELFEAGAVYVVLYSRDL